MSKWRAITVDVPDMNLFEASVKQNLNKVVEPSKRDFESFVGTWREAPEIIIKQEEKNNSISAFTGVESNWSKGKTAKPEDIFMFLTRGTSVRYAQMDREFRAKTRIRVISSGTGGGPRDPRVVRTDDPQEGIAAREIEEAVAEKNKPKIENDLQKVIEDAAKVSNLMD